MTSAYSLSTNQSRGFDLLKFVAAIAIIAAHCGLCKEWPVIESLRETLCDFFIPIFFALSSYLFTLRLQRNAHNPRKTLNTTVKRLSLLFIIWYIIMLPWAWKSWFSIATPKETVVALFFGCTFSGYWFIKALIINTIILYICFKNKTLYRISWIVFGIYYAFTSFNYIYHFIELPFSPYFNFSYHVVPCLFGMYAASKGTFNLVKAPTAVLSFVFILLVISDINFVWVKPIYKFAAAFIVCALAERIKYPESLPYITYRKASTILYMVQFALIMSYEDIVEYMNWPKSSIITFMVVLTSALIISFTIIRLSAYEKLNKLSYTY